MPSPDSHAATPADPPQGTFRSVAPARAIASRLAAVQPFLAMDVLAEAASLERAGRDIVHMEVGQPSAPAPRAVREAASVALGHGRIGYTPALGLSTLRERIAQHYRETYGITVAPERVVVTTGSSAGFVLAFLALFEPGARIAITAPGYPAYRNIMAALGLEPVPVALRAADGWRLTAAHVAAAQAPLAGVLAMSPANPSGTMIDPGGLAAIAETCRANGTWLVSDEIYHGLTYGREAATALASDPEAIVVNSFSKYYCMTGWRIGWLVVPDRLVRPIERLAQNLYISPPYLSQVAALAAFEARDELESVKADYAAARSLLLTELPRLGIAEIHPADGAFYLYADVARFTNDSIDFCRRLLNEAGIAATPGPDFDPVEGSHHLRLSFAGGEAVCREAVRRLGDWLRRGG